MLEPHPDLTLDVIHGLGWIYIILAAMNFTWAVHVFRKGTHFRTGLGGLLSAPQDVPSAAPWALYATLLFLVSIGHLVANSDPEHFMIRLPLFFKVAVDRAHRQPGDLFHFLDRPVRPGRRGPPLAGQADCRLDVAEPDLAFHDAEPDGLRLPADRRQARQCADRFDALHRRFLHLAVFQAGRRKRRSDRSRAARPGGREQRKSPGVARPGLYRADLHGRLDGGPGGLGHRAAGAVGGAGLVGPHAQSVQGRRGTSWDCRKCWCTTTRGLPASCSPA